MTIFGAKMKKVSDNPVNVYSRIERQDSTVNMNVAIELEKDKYAGSKEFTAVREYLLDFAKDRYLAVIDDQLSKEKKDLRDLKKDAKSIDRNQARNEKSIKKYDDLISSEQQKLAEFNNQQTSISSDITRLESGGMGAPESDTGTSALKDLKKEQKKVSREIKKSEKKIKHAERKIDKSQNDITGSYNDQYEANNKVTEQESVVKRLEIKRDAIKNFK
jgi:peptidoglycan hydrolase CwlO-like protein